MEMEETLKILNSSLSTIKWRLKSASQASSRNRYDILALCTGIRPVIMVDYGGKMPELQEYLCALLKLCQKESPVFEDLRVMIIEDMIYFINVKELAEHVSSSLISEAELQFVDLEQDPPKMITITENSSVGMQLISVQKLFLSFFPLDKMNNDVALCMSESQSSDKPVASQSSEVIDLSNCLHDSQVTVPTLNGEVDMNVKYQWQCKMFTLFSEISTGMSTINPTINPSKYGT
ncbi:hypothetical protein Patl1_26417 [Pistacia atlantica]|uniref:Uncharacterized protein n=1 Tax=Pistacia atlantica TaxID=434234 RepID=A0ACC1AZN7_9ROSI|nr:hypothetical protein Patl1_26417 [Pistacia atlantica]